MTRLRTPPLAAALLGALAACASSGPPPVRTATRLEPIAGATAAVSPTAPAGPGASALPDLASTQPSIVTASSRVELEATDQELRTVLRGLANSFGLDFQIDPGVSGRVTTRLRGVTLDQALREIVRGRGLSWSVQDGILRVEPARLATRIFTLDYVALSRTGTATTVVQRRLSGSAVSGSGAGGLSTSGVNAAAMSQNPASFGTPGGDVISSVSVADLWEEARISLEGLVFSTATDSAGRTAQGARSAGAGARTGGAYSRVDPDGTRLIINPMAGTILVTASIAKLAEVEAFIAAFEGSVQRQVLIEAKIVEITLDKSRSFGIDWNVVAGRGNVGVSGGSSNASSQGAGGANIEFKLAAGSTQISAVLQALSTQGDVRVLSSPRVSALNNQRAVFDVTTDEVFFVVTRQPVLGPNGTAISFSTQIVPQQISVGIVLDVLTQIAPDNTLTMNIRPVVTSVARVEQIQLEDGSTARAPVVDRRETDTMARLRAGETVIIGGLMQTRFSRERRGVPGLKDIPILGALFSRTEDVERRAELVIFLTPTVIAGQAPGSATGGR
ncbi:MAG: hypothetical protein ACYC1S_03210 [Gemmatimonadaceae bacterium]